MKLIAQGAEAKIYQGDGFIVKRRTKKSYRLPELDLRLRKSRTKREMKVLNKLHNLNFPVPEVYTNSPDFFHINMEQIKGDKLRDVLNKKNAAIYGKEIGSLIATLHNNEIVHGDLTTSNMILHKKIHFIDFGLSFFSNKTEHFAVDLHLLRQALESYHNDIWQKCFSAALSSYKKAMPTADAVLRRLEKVESRGRYKGHRF